MEGVNPAINHIRDVLHHSSVLHTEIRVASLKRQGAQRAAGAAGASCVAVMLVAWSAAEGRERSPVETSSVTVKLAARSAAQGRERSPVGARCMFDHPEGKATDLYIYIYIYISI